MARGKHGTAAAVRHEVQSREAEIATYQRAVARLTGERDELRRQLDKERKANAQRGRELRALVREATSPQVEALKLELAERTRQRDAAIAKHREMLKSNNKVMRRMQDHFASDHGLRGMAASEAAMAIIDPEQFGNIRLVESSDMPRYDGLPDAVIEVLQRKRGQR